MNEKKGSRPQCQTGSGESNYTFVDAPVRAADLVCFRKVTVHICSRAGNTYHNLKKTNNFAMLLQIHLESTRGLFFYYFLLSGLRSTLDNVVLLQQQHSEITSK